MTHTEQFIEDAIAMGWIPEGHDLETLQQSDVSKYGISWAGGSFNPSIREILLDPKAWQAVGNMRGWDSMKMLHYGTRFTHKKRSEVEHNWHMFIDHLADGKTIEEALEAISQ